MTPPPPEVGDPIVQVAEQIGAEPEWLAALIAFESNFDPRAAKPTSTAKGLIQFIDDTAVELGYASSADLVKQHPTYMSQMYGPVLEYLRRYAPYSSKQELYMAVFQPVARFWDPDERFSQKTIDANLRNGEEWITTPADYVALVDGYAVNVLKPAGAVATAIVQAGDTIKDVGKIGLMVVAAIVVLDQLS